MKGQYNILILLVFVLIPCFGFKSVSVNKSNLNKGKRKIANVESIEGTWLKTSIQCERGRKIGINIYKSNEIEILKISKTQISRSFLLFGKNSEKNSYCLIESRYKIPRLDFPLRYHPGLGMERKSSRFLSRGPTSDICKKIKMGKNKAPEKMLVELTQNGEGLTLNPENYEFSRNCKNPKFRYTRILSLQDYVELRSSSDLVDDNITE